MNYYPQLEDLDPLANSSKKLPLLSLPISSSSFSFLFSSYPSVMVENGTTHVTSFIYSNPSLKALLSHLDLAGNTNSNHIRSTEDPSSAAFCRHRRSPFLHLTCVGTLNGDFFSSNDDDSCSFFWPNEKSSVNSSFVFFGSFNLKSGFSDLVIDNGIRVWEVFFITLMAD